MKGLVLRKTLFGESDLILKVLLEDNRILSLFAAGARRSLRRFPHRFDLSGVYDLEWTETSTSEKLLRLKRADLDEWQPELSRNIEAWTRWLIILEWISHYDEDAADFSEVMRLREDLLSDSIAGGLSFHRIFLKQMRTQGLFPELDQCLTCHRPVDAPVFVLGLGGVTHAPCHAGLAMSASTRAFMRSEGEGAPPASEQRRTIDELDRISVPYLMQQLGRSLKAQSFFEQLGSQGLSSYRD